MAHSDGASQSLKSGRRLFTLIEYVGRYQPVGVTDLSKALDLPKSTTQVYLNTLREAGFVVKEPTGYRLSLRFYEQGMNAIRSFRLFPAARAKVYELAEETGELVAAWLEEGGQGVFAIAAGGLETTRNDVNTGARSELHSTAGGKAILAHLPREYVEEIIATRGLRKMTNSTITDPSDLWEELAAIRQDGVAYNQEEHVKGLNGVAAPVLCEDTVLGAISIAGPANRLLGSYLEEELTAVIKGSANEIELNLEFDEALY